jgi:uncharacterized protein (DUF433 family)
VTGSISSLDSNRCIPVRVRLASAAVDGPILDWREHLVRNPEICCGELCAAGTRVPVTVILDSLAEGAGRDEILFGYPALRSVHIDAALVYAAELAHEESLLPFMPREIQGRRGSSRRDSR